MNEIFDFLASGSASNATIGEFAASIGDSEEHVVDTICSIAGKMVSFMRSGKLAEVGLDVASVDPEQLAAGIEIEYEHTVDRSIAKKIAMDHLAENPSYYTYLYDMEQQMGDDAGNEQGDAGEQQGEEEYEDDVDDSKQQQEQVQ